METKKSMVKVEKHTDLAQTGEKMMAVEGLEDIPVSMIPVPIYKLVQPGSTKIATSDGGDAPAGTILMKDNGEAVESFKFLLLRAKRQVRKFLDDDNIEQQSPVITILGLNIDRGFSPFVLSLSVASFSPFGKLMAQIKEAKITTAWQFTIKVTTEKQEMEKNTSSGRKMVKYWILNFVLGKTETSEEDLKIAELAYQEFAASLDRGQVNEDKGVVEEIKDTEQMTTAKKVFEEDAEDGETSNNSKDEEDSDIPF